MRKSSQVISFLCARSLEKYQVDQSTIFTYMDSLRERVAPLFDASGYDRLFRKGGPGRKYGWHFRLFHFSVLIGVTLGFGFTLKKHTEYHMRRQHEEFVIRSIFEQNFTEMSPRQLQSYVQDSREKFSPEWMGAKEKLWKTQYTQINNHVAQLRTMNNILDQMSRDVEQIKKDR